MSSLEVVLTPSLHPSVDGPALVFVVSGIIAPLSAEGRTNRYQRKAVIPVNS